MPIGRSVLMGKPRKAAGQRDKYVVIQQRTVPEGGSFPVSTWTDLGPAWMSKQDVHADEPFRVAQASAFSGTKFELDYRPDMDPDALDIPADRRLVYLGKTYDIRSASMIGTEAIELLTLVKAG